LYKPAILTCKTREEFLKWLRITRRCGYFHQASQELNIWRCSSCGMTPDDSKERVHQ
jgi:hypothetical protein